jgi:activator of HSP90 ATPase
MYVCISRREFSLHVTALAAAGSGLAALIPASLGATSPGQTPGEVSHDAESIHQVITFTASPARIYQTLLDATQFSAMTKFSMVPNAPPARIAPDVGGAFALFDGHIVGRHVELVPDHRVVQAWRTADWEAGLYSLARFALASRGSGTVLTFDHTGFPKGQGEHLAQGWYANYWTPMKKHLG